MKIDIRTFKEINIPIYIIEEVRLRNNLELIRSVACAADVEIILAFKAFALWKVFLIMNSGAGRILIRPLIRMMISKRLLVARVISHSTRCRNGIAITR